MTDLVERLRDGYTYIRPFPLLRIDVGPTVEPTYAIKDHEVRDLLSALEAKDKELAALRANPTPQDYLEMSRMWAAEKARAETTERERDEAREALKPFATMGARWPESCENDNAEIVVTVSSLRRAARAITGEKQ